MPALQTDRANRIQVASEIIDLVHLARQSHGDRELELELLALFERQCGQIVERLGDLQQLQSGAARADLAHRLRGSALAIGANGVAAAADAIEQAIVMPAGEHEYVARLDNLRQAAAVARAVARDLLAA